MASKMARLEADAQVVESHAGRMGNFAEIGVHQQSALPASGGLACLHRQAIMTNPFKTAPFVSQGKDTGARCRFCTIISMRSWIPLGQHPSHGSSVIE